MTTPATPPTCTPPAAQPAPLRPTPVTDALAMELGHTPDGYLRNKIPGSSFWTAIELAREFEAKHAAVADELQTLRLLYRSAVSAAMGNAQPLPAPDPSRAALVAALRGLPTEEELGKLYQDVLNCGVGDPWDAESGCPRPVPEGFEAEVEKFDAMHAQSIADINACLDIIRPWFVKLRAARQALADAAGKDTK